jgi:nucleotide-binding universal stress UspA family protein
MFGTPPFTRRRNVLETRGTSVRWRLHADTDTEIFMFERFLLAINDSPGSEVAIDFSGALARSSAASVHVLLVNEYLVGGRGLTLLTTAEATDLITAAVDQLRAAGVSASGTVRTATYREVAACIVEVARECEADAVVLGSHRHRRLGRVFSPRVRERTTRLTPLPVLTAPSPLNLAKRAALTMDDMVRRQVEHDLMDLPQ